MTVYDQLNLPVTLTALPQRIISTVPSQTELLFYLGLNQQITGITRFCTHPANKVKFKTKIGGTKQLDVALIKSLNPDLIIANKEENDRTQITALVDSGLPVYISDPADLASATAMIRDVGILTDKQQAADNLATEIAYRFSILKPLQQGLRVAYLIWRKPYMAAGSDTFINNMLQQCGLVNAFGQNRYPEITPEDLERLQPDVVFLSSEPYPFKQKHADEIKGILPNTIIRLVDGEMFSWYGSRLLLAPRYFNTLINSLF